MVALLEPDLDPPRGVIPRILLEQVRNTTPFLWSQEDNPRSSSFIRILREADPLKPQTHAEYFELCLSAHHATVATYVPTDVDNQIRYRLWHPSLSTGMIRAMAERVLESLEWDCRPVSARFLDPIRVDMAGPVLSGHLGEWFSTAAGAYGALRKRDADAAAQVAERILREICREAEIYSRLKKARAGVEMLQAATIIAHNLGDLDRVIDLWNLSEDDALRVSVYGLGSSGTSPRLRAAAPVLREVGRMNTRLMAHENHRHFALRGPRCLRRSGEFLLPIGPFLDEWGAKIAKHPGLSSKEVGEISESLIQGAEKLRAGAAAGSTPAPIGYARALCGILEGFPGGFPELCHFLPAKWARELKAGPLRSAISISKTRFEEQWKQRALKSSSG